MAGVLTLIFVLGFFLGLVSGEWARLIREK